MFYYPLPNWKVFCISGPDTADFLQRVSSQNYKQPRAGEAKDMAVLSATGDIIGFCVGYQATASNFYFAVDEREYDGTLAQLEAFFFTEALEIKARPELCCVILSGAFTPAAELLEQEFTRTTLDEHARWLLLPQNKLCDFIILITGSMTLPVYSYLMAIKHLVIKTAITTHFHLPFATRSIFSKLP